MLKGFKEFVMRGNIVELAVAVIIAGAFAPIVKAVTDFILNLIGAIFGAPSFDAVGQFTVNGAVIQPGTILTAIANFLLVAAAVYFMVVMPMQKAEARRAKAEPAAEAEEVVPSEEVLLLREIRDSLQKH
ncbi:large conductance mechanosensitive channel protein MscL [Boudabousia marimammalium]|uniref:Large-conductance mechanosensitive channel n=1 Tax=Boudabousia marimammalium TaxID=156892 RepID=A0A1Q5PL54_9ACTO|nr:large conductance mechanosensitive channel protein MscL [Boudabousia marimammalium]OKL47362.1 mechanosensitive ion channel protein MscL [Boudabousia marimammalium]